MPALGLMFVAGAWMLQQMPMLPGLGWLLPLAIAALLLWRRRRRADWPQRLGWLVWALAAGFMWAACAAHVRLAEALPPAWEGRDIQLIGVVASLPQSQERGQRFEFDVERVLTSGAAVPAHISLTRYQTGFSAVDPGPDDRRREPALHAGERWQLTVRLKRPHGNLNPHGFDLEAWLLERDIRATGYVREDADNRRLQVFVPRLSYAVEALREHIRIRMAAALAGQPYGGILQALAIGDEAAIDTAQWETFRRTGTSHLISISGLHITMLAGLVFGLAYHLWRRSQRLTLRLPARKAATVAALAAAICYALIAGFSVPTQRTLYMLAVFAAALCFGRSLEVARVLSYALALVALLDPWAVLAPGFWLSFGAVALIAFAATGRLQPPHWLRTAINTQWAISLGLVPLLLVLFQQVSLVSPLANALAIPLVSFVVVPLTLIGAALPLTVCCIWHMAACRSSCSSCNGCRCCRLARGSKPRRLPGPCCRRSWACCGCCCRAAFPCAGLGWQGCCPCCCCSRRLPRRVRWKWPCSMSVRDWRSWCVRPIMRCFTIPGRAIPRKATAAAVSSCLTCGPPVSPGWMAWS